MLVSCLMPTYGRLPQGRILLEEAIESFLRQDYDDRELLVLNDCPGQEIICEAPGVVVVNLQRRFRSLGEKYNALVGLSRGQLICPWEDDDVSLPWRLSLSVSMLCDYSAAYYTPKKYWFWDGDYRLDHPMGVGHNCGIFTRTALRAVGGYPPISGAQDMVVDQKLAAVVASRGAVEFGDPVLSRHLWYYIMRWQTGSYHLSAPDNHEAFYDDLGNMVVREGAYILRPRWSRDYVRETREALGRLGDA